MMVERAEIWLPVPGWDAYEVSSLGDVRRVKPQSGTRPGRSLKAVVGRHGYLRVHLSQDGKVRILMLSRVVCEAFHGAPPPGAVHAAHGNGDYTDNRAANLRWATAKENQADAKAHGTWTRGERQGKAKLTEEAVRRIRASENKYDLSPVYGITKRNIRAILARRTWKHVA